MSLAIDLEGRNALVTGGSRGIGAACCRLLAEAGAAVGVHCRVEREAAEAVAREVRGAGGRAAVLAAEISDPEEVSRLFGEFGEAIGPPDILVNSAGIWKRAAVADMSPAQLEETLAVNLMGTTWCCSEAARAMAGRTGSIVNISSTAGQRGEAFHAHYAASKGGIHALTKSLAEELGPGVRVNCVAPGWVDTDMARTFLDGPRGEAIRDETGIGRVATAEEIAAAAVFLATEAPASMTGCIVDVNGASYLRT